MAQRRGIVRVTPELRLVEVLEEAREAPVLLDQDGVVFRLVRDEDQAETPVTRSSYEREQNSSARPTSPPSVEERLAIIERMLKRRDEIFQGRVLPDDSVDILRAEREARSAHLASLQ